MTDMKTLNRLSIFAACMLLGMPLAGQAAENPRFEVQGTEKVAGTPLPDADLIFGLTTTNRIISFAPGAPNVLLSNVQILGLGIGENVVGIDFRPATEELYGVTDGSRVLRTKPMKGTAARGATPEQDRQAAQALPAPASQAIAEDAAVAFAGGEAAATTAAPAVAEPAPRAAPPVAQEINGLAIVWALIKNWWLGLFGKKA